MQLVVKTWTVNSTETRDSSPRHGLSTGFCHLLPFSHFTLYMYHANIDWFTIPSITETWPLCMQNYICHVSAFSARVGNSKFKRSRVKREEKSLENGCLCHRTTVAGGAIAQYIRYIIEYLMSPMAAGKWGAETGKVDRKRERKKEKDDIDSFVATEFYVYDQRLTTGSSYFWWAVQCWQYFQVKTTKTDRRFPLSEPVFR